MSLITFCVNFAVASAFFGMLTWIRNLKPKPKIWTRTVGDLVAREAKRQRWLAGATPTPVDMYEDAQETLCLLKEFANTEVVIAARITRLERWLEVQEYLGVLHEARQVKR